MSGKLCPTCGKEQAKKFSKRCSMCGSPLGTPGQEKGHRPGDANPERFSLNRRLLEAMVILASIDGRIGESELETLIGFTCHLGKDVAGFEARPLFEALVIEVQALDDDTRLLRLREHGELFRKAYSDTFNRSFLADFESMITADGKITGKEAAAFGILRDAMNKPGREKPEHVDTSPAATSRRIIASIIKAGVFFALSDGELRDEETQIIGAMAKTLNRNSVFRPEEIHAMTEQAVHEAGGLDLDQKTLEVGRAGGMFAATLDLKTRKSLLKAFKSIIYADGVVAGSEETLFKALVSTMFPEAQPKESPPPRFPKS